MTQELISSADLAGVMESALATGLLSSFCTIQSPSGTFGPSGAPDGVYAAVSGLKDIQCQAAPVASGPAGTEGRLTPEILSRQPLHVLLGGHYPTITSKMRAVIDGVNHDIASAESDSQSVMTRLLVMRATI